MKPRTDRTIVPRARKDDLVVRELPDEVLVYDLKRNQAHCLNQCAAFVWRHCDGRLTVADVARQLSHEFAMPVNEQIVWLALDQLRKFHLLQERTVNPLTAPVISRRELARALGIATAAIALPVVISIKAPAAMQAATAITPQACSQRPPSNCGNTPCVGGGTCRNIDRCVCL